MFIARSWSATSTPSVFPFRLLNNHLLEMTVSMWGFSTILGYWSCSALFFYFSSFMDLILDLNMCFWALAFSEAHSYSLFSNPGIVTSLLNLVVFLDVEFFTLDLSCSSTCFEYCPSLCPLVMTEPYCYCFECCFYINQAPSSIFSWDVLL